MNNQVAPSGAAGSAGTGMKPLWIVLIIAAVVCAVIVVVVIIVVAVVLTQSDDGDGNGKFVCGDGTKLPKSARCDGYAECEDGSDEDDCNCDSEYESACSSDGVCIWNDWFCDGTDDCSEGEDEDGCGLTCDASEFACKDHSECVPLANRCDQTAECDDGSDEWDCLSIEDYSGEPVLLVKVGENTWRPVCSTDWQASYNDAACDEMGFGSGASQSTIAQGSVDEVDNGWANADGNAVSSSMLEVLSTSSSCTSNTAVTLTCSYDEPGTRGPGVPATTGQQLIVQGYRAQEGAWPWQVAFEEDGSQICGGSLIYENWVLTAAHCIFYQASRYSVRLGSNKKSGDDTYLQTANAEVIIVHPDYDDRTVENDVALVKLETDLTITDYVRLVRLPEQDEDLTDSIVCYTSGWGGINPAASVYPDLLQDVKMPLISDSQCNVDQSIISVGGLDDDTMQCAGYSGGYITICNGDSGGPLVCRDKRNVWTLSGVTSWGVSGGGGVNCGSVSVYAQVTAFRDWIDSTIAANSGS